MTGGAEAPRPYPQSTRPTRPRGLLTSPISARIRSRGPASPSSAAIPGSGARLHQHHRLQHRQDLTRQPEARQQPGSPTSRLARAVRPAFT